jgi:hypothetical protein
MTTETQDTTHYTVSQSDLIDSQIERFNKFVDSGDKFAKVGGTTYKHSLWAVRTDSGIQIWRTPHDPDGRWVKAAKRTWNN